MNVTGGKCMNDIRLKKIVKRAVQEIQDGMNVNLGIGMPTLVANEIPSDFNVLLQSEKWIARNRPLPCRRTGRPRLN
ncbi:hypothetical protein GCM10020331_074600 [Ectobacillus funiculus]